MSSNMPFLEREPLVDAAVVAKFLGFAPVTVRRMADRKQIPSVPFRNGRRTFRKFYLSAVDQAMRARMEMSEPNSVQPDDTNEPIRARVARKVP